MPVMYDPVTGEFIILSESHCNQLLEDTSCDAPGCSGFRCVVCGAGCDIQEPDSDCEQSIADETVEQYAARRTAERDAWGLPSPGPEAT